MSDFMQLRERLGCKIKMVVWSDCGGMSTELLALNSLKRTLTEKLSVELELVLYAFCDSSKPSQQFATMHNPKHVADDMMSRDFNAGTFVCNSCNITHELPKGGVDLYVCCFPCGPWSSRGKQFGFYDESGDICWQSIKTIK